MRIGRHILTGVLLASVCAAAAISGAHAADMTGKDLKIGVVLKTLSNPFWRAMQQGIQDTATAMGATATIQAGTDELSIDEQTTIMQTMAGQDYNCFIAAPISATNLIQPLVAVAAKKVPIIGGDAFDEDALKAANVKLATWVTSRNQDAGQQAGAEMSKKLGGKGNVAILGGLAGNPASADRLSGFKSSATGLTIVQEQAADWDKEKALNAIDAILKAHPDLAGIYAANDTMALGAQQAVDNAGLTGKVLVYGTDAIDDALTSVEAGEMAGTAGQFPYVMGQMEVEACLAAAQGATLPYPTISPIALITKDNVADAKAKAPKPFFDFNDPIAALIKK